jgi:hypothetical protein
MEFQRKSKATLLRSNMDGPLSHPTHRARGPVHRFTRAGVLRGLGFFVPSPNCVEEEFSEVRPLNKVASGLIRGREHPTRAKSLRDCYLATHRNYVRISPFRPGPEGLHLSGPTMQRRVLSARRVGAGGVSWWHRTGAKRRAGPPFGEWTRPYDRSRRTGHVRESL